VVVPYQHHALGAVFLGLVRVEDKLNAAKYRVILNESLVQSIQNLGLSRRFTFQDNNPKHTAKTMQERLMDNSVNVIEWPSQSLGLKPIKHL